MSRVTLAVVLCAIGCAAAPARSAQPDTGAALFTEKCAMCHRVMGMGTDLLARRMDKAQSVLENRPAVNPAFVTVAVRTGLRNMPPISRAEVSNTQLAAIEAYLTAPRQPLPVPPATRPPVPPAAATKQAGSQ